MRIEVIMLGLLLQGFSVSAQETPASPNSTQADIKTASGRGSQTADYGAAFEQLLQLGLPDARGAKCVYLTLHRNDNRQAYYDSSNSNPLQELKLRGNAWLLPGQKEGASTLIYSGLSTVEVVKKAKRGALLRLLAGPGKAPKKGGQLGDWTEEDVAKDTQRILKGLGRLAAANEMFDSDQWGYSEQGANFCAALLIHACHMHRAGFENEANQITSRLFSLAPKPVLVMDAVVHQIAEDKYKKLTDAFYQNKDWAVYQTGVKALHNRYTRGWKNREGVELLLARIEEVKNGKEAKLAKLKGASLRPEAVKILDQLLVQQKPIIINAQRCWLFGAEALNSESGDSYSGYGGEEPSQPWLKNICAMGMDGFIALAAVAADDSLIATSMSEGNDYGYYSSYNDDGNSSDAETQYKNLQRPCNRGEIARAILLKTLPDENGELASLSPLELQAVAHQWWLTHRTDSPAQLAKLFLEGGDSTQQMLAVQVLIRSGDDQDARKVEDFIMSAEALARNISTVELYLKARRGKARAFFASYSKALRDQVEEDEDDYNNWQIKQAGGIDKFLKRLAVYVDEVSVDKILLQMKSGKLEPETGMNMYATAMPKGELRQHLPELISLIHSTSDRKKQLAYFRAIQTVVHQDQSVYHSGERWEGYLDSMPAVLEQSEKEWSSFLTLTEANELREFGNAPSVAAMAAWLVHTIYFPQYERTLREASRFISADELWTLALTQAKAMIKDPHNVSYPSAAKVSEAERKKIRKKLQPMKTDEVAAYYQTLDLNHKLAWAEVLGGYEKMPAGVEGLKKVVMRLDWSRAVESDEVTRKKVSDLVLYQKVEAEMIDQILDLMFESAGTMHDEAFILQTGGPEGAALYGWTGDDLSVWKENKLDAQLADLRSGAIKEMAGAAFIRGSEEVEDILLRNPQAKELDRKKLTSAMMKALEQGSLEGQTVSLMFFAETSKALNERDTKKTEDEKKGSF